MVIRRTPHDTSEAWSGFWGADARYYARRSDGACFVIDGAARIVELAEVSAAAAHARAATIMPMAGRYELRVVAAQPAAEGVRQARLFAYGVRRSR